MPIWEMPAIEAQPTVSLIRWTVVRFKTENLQADFVYGWDVDNACGRTSSAISDVDRVALSVQTRTGRVYRLCGQSRSDAQGEYVFRQKYAGLTSLCAAVDVSQEYQCVAVPADAPHDERLEPGELRAQV